MEHGSGEGFNASKRRERRAAERPGAVDNYIKVFGFPPRGADGPPAGCVVPAGFGDLGVEADKRAKVVFVGHPFQIRKDLGLLRIGAGPVRVGLERK